MKSDPFERFNHWYQMALEAKVPHPDAMTLVTATRRGKPSARIVLFKGFRAESRGFLFFTNYLSQKGKELAKNPQVTAVFFWPSLDRQIRVEGRVAKISRGESEDYFRSRPRGSQLGAWASEQSKPIPDRAALERRLAQFEKKFAGKEVPCPPHWGGYCLVPERFEFWEGKVHRLHDRFEYTRKRGAKTKRWKLLQLAP